MFKITDLINRFVMPRALVPDEDELRSRLELVITSSHMRKHFVPMLLSKAGKTMNGEQLATFVQDQIFDYAQNKPQEICERLQFLSGTIIEMMMPDMYVLVDAAYHNRPTRQCRHPDPYEARAPMIRIYGCGNQYKTL